MVNYEGLILSNANVDQSACTAMYWPSSPSIQRDDKVRTRYTRRNIARFVFDKRLLHREWVYFLSNLPVCYRFTLEMNPTKCCRWNANPFLNRNIASRLARDDWSRLNANPFWTAILLAASRGMKYITLTLFSWASNWLSREYTAKSGRIDTDWCLPHRYRHVVSYWAQMLHNTLDK